MGQTACRYSSREQDYVCRFEAWGFVKFVVGSTGNDPFIFNAISMIVMMILVIISLSVKYIDFSTSYLTTILIPMIMQRFCSWIVSFRQYWKIPRPVTNGAYIGIEIASVATDLHLPLATLIFLFMNLVTACNRKEHGRGATWTPFVISLIVATAAGVFSFFESSYWDPYYYIGNYRFWFTFFIYCFHGACLFIILIIPFVACCCSGSKPGQSSSPVVANAKSRMLWSILFCICILLPSLISNVFREQARYTQLHYYGIHVEGEIGTISLFIMMIHPIFICIAALLFLPAYRSVLCCSQGYARGGKITDTKSKQNAPVQPIYGPNQSQAAIPSAPPQAVERHIDQNLVAYLNNPNIAPPLPNQRMPPVPPAAAPCPNCAQLAAYNCQSGHLHQQAMMQKIPQDMSNVLQVPQQQVAFQAFAVSPMQQQAFVTQPATLVRFASQPNLVQFNSMQPSVSMPHIAAAQNPFYIHS